MKIKIIMYIISLSLSIGLNTEIYNPAMISNTYVGIIFQFILIYIFIRWAGLRNIEKSKETLKGFPMILYVIGLSISLALGIALSFRSGTQYCRVITGIMVAIWDRSYVAMKLFSIYPFVNIPKFLYILVKGKAPNVDPDYFNRKQQIV